MENIRTIFIEKNVISANIQYFVVFQNCFMNEKLFIQMEIDFWTEIIIWFLLIYWIYCTQEQFSVFHISIFWLTPNICWHLKWFALWNSTTTVNKYLLFLKSRFFIEITQFSMKNCCYRPQNMCIYICWHENLIYFLQAEKPQCTTYDLCRISICWNWKHIPSHSNFTSIFSLILPPSPPVPI